LDRSAVKALSTPFPGTPPPIGPTGGRDRKGKVSVVIYLAAIPLAFVPPWISAWYVLVAILWLIPDRRIERTRHE
jgi:hypothetical protein